MERFHKLIFDEAQATIAKGIVYCSGNIGCTNSFVVVEGGVQAQTVSA